MGPRVRVVKSRPHQRHHRLTPAPLNRLDLEPMSRPPRTLFLPLANPSQRPGWTQRLDALRKQFEALATSQDQRAAIVRWQEQEFILSALRISGVSLELDHVQDLVVSQGGLTGSHPDGSRFGIPGLIASRFLVSLRLIEHTVEQDGPAARLSNALLLCGFSSKGTANTGCTDRDESAHSTSDQQLPVPLALLSQWTDSESFAELHPVEQSAVILLRLKEISRLRYVGLQASPDTVETEVDCLALAASSLPLLREKLPPLIIPEGLFPRYADALDEGFRMNTRPMVEFLAESIDETLAKLIDLL